MIVIGIDTGTHTGVAIAVNGILQELHTTDFWGCITIIKNAPLYHNSDKVTVVIEKSKTKHVWQKNARGGKQNSVSFDVGKPYHHAELIEEYCQKNGIDCITKHPQGKIDAEQFALATGWTKRCSQHARDAGMLALSIK